MVAETLHVHVVHHRVVAHVSQENRGLHHVSELRSVRFELRTQVRYRLAQLAFEPAGDELAVGQANLTRNDEPLAGAYRWRVRTNWFRSRHRRAFPVGSV